MAPHRPSPPPYTPPPLTAPYASYVPSRPPHRTASPPGLRIARRPAPPPPSPSPGTPARPRTRPGPPSRRGSRSRSPAGPPRPAPSPPARLSRAACSPAHSPGRHPRMRAGCCAAEGGGAVQHCRKDAGTPVHPAVRRLRRSATAMTDCNGPLQLTGLTGCCDNYTLGMPPCYCMPISSPAETMSDR